MHIESIDYNGMKTILGKNYYSGNILDWNTSAPGYTSGVLFMSFDGQFFIKVNGPAPSTLLTDFPNAELIAVDALQILFGSGTVISPIKADGSSPYDAFKALVANQPKPSGNVFYSQAPTLTGLYFISYDGRFCIEAFSSEIISVDTITADFPNAVQITLAANQVGVDIEVSAQVT